MRAHPESKLDEYAKQAFRQNRNLPCEHCGSSMGHRSTCPLLNEGVANVIAAVSYVATKLYDIYTEADRIIARGWGVKL